MADVTSQRHSLDNAKFLTDFPALFPPPQDESWTLFRISNKVTSKVCLELLNQQSILEPWRRLPTEEYIIATYFPTYDEKLSTLSQPEQIDVLVSFAQHVHSGGVSRRKQHVRAQTIQVSLRAITTRFKLDGEQSPVVTPQGKYQKKISQLLEGYKRKDPSPKF
jgi:hypothetical protein